MEAMCGIAGILNIGGRKSLQVSPIQRMANSMAVRGPDDEGFLLVCSRAGARAFAGEDTIRNRDLPGGEYLPDHHVADVVDESFYLALGHRRLSIVDVTARGHQPMSLGDGRYWIVYNGEIYNYRDVARELEGRNVSLQTSCDTEVVIKAYATWGEDCLCKFNGMFAFAIWDNETQSLFCARDRIGIKPFYYTFDHGTFIFASDIKAIIASGLYTPSVDEEGLYLAMAFGIAPRPKTAFRNVAALEQAHWMRVSLDGSVTKQRYWSIPVGSQLHSMMEGEAAELLEEQLTRSIKRRLIADVEIGTFMSGGIDSTTISSIASNMSPGVKAFTLSYPDAPEMGEVEQAKATARGRPMKHIIHDVVLHSSVEDLNQCALLYEEPFYDISPILEISSVVRRNGVKVVLSGLGGDELFAGYRRYSFLPTWERLKSVRTLISLLAPLAGRRGERLRASCAARTADQVHTAMFMISADARLHDLFNNEALKRIDTLEYMRAAYVGDLEFEDGIEAMSYMDLMNYIGNHHVHRLDQFTMAHSLEARVPFLDHELVEAAFRIPSKWKMAGGVPKKVLKNVAAKYIAPECITMPKKGFGLPLGQWLSSTLGDIIVEKIEHLGRRELISAEAAREWYALYQRGRLKPQQVWHLVALELWFENFIDGGGRAIKTMASQPR